MDGIVAKEAHLDSLIKRIEAIIPREPSLINMVKMCAWCHSPGHVKKNALTPLGALLMIVLMPYTRIIHIVTHTIQDGEITQISLGIRATKQDLPISIIKVNLDSKGLPLHNNLFLKILFLGQM